MTKNTNENRPRMVYQTDIEIASQNYNWLLQNWLMWMLRLSRFGLPK